jgi:hypothetical protein
VAETLDPAWAAWLDEITLKHNADGSTTLSGRFANQERLFQLLSKIGELGMTLLAVEMAQETNDSAFSSDSDVC